MKNSILTNYNRKRTALLLLPLLVVSFLTLGFWALGGGRNIVLKQSVPSGLNPELPDAFLKSDAAENKLSFYEKAEQDSARRTAQHRNDPLYRMSFQPPDTAAGGERLGTSLYDPTPLLSGQSTDSNEVKVYHKLAALNQELQGAMASTIKKEALKTSGNSMNHTTTENTDAGEQVQPVFLQKDVTRVPDPELTQLNEMMDKILDIQHPPYSQDRKKEAVIPLATESYSVSSTPPQASFSLLDTTGRLVSTDEGFYNSGSTESPEPQKAIEAVVPESQSLTSGAILKLRLVHPAYINGIFIPGGALLYGTATLNGERLQVNITSLRQDQLLFPVQVEVYDWDGLPGIYIPNPGNTDRVRQTAANTLQTLQLGSVDGSLKTEAALQGINALKALLQKHQKERHLVVPAGYKVLLKNKVN